mmetsp:Transcript_100970/g.175301  ORF Transcript_100970/g.175301 Transcript_100970/m.175301 type:complete len:520 (-) Transcript_100970:279-1838(-)
MFPTSYYTAHESQVDVKELNSLSLASTQAPDEQDNVLDHLFDDDCGADVRKATFELGHPNGSKGGFYGLMRETYSLRAKVSQILLNDTNVCVQTQASMESLLSALQVTLAHLQSIPRPDGWCDGDGDHVHALMADAATEVKVRLGYEANELIRDVSFIQGGEVSVMQNMQKLHESRRSTDIEWIESKLPTWTESLDGALRAMHAATKASGQAPARRFRNFITDRDGTINNYCDRYASSIQAAYNSVFIGKFSKHCADKTILITAAPLGGRPGSQGLMELCTMPPGVAVYAGSKGREYFDSRAGQVLEVEPLPAKVRTLLQDVCDRLVLLCSKPENSKFLGLGSGLQHKFGELTIARNDPGGSVSAEESLRFKAEIQHVMSEIDPMGSELDMHDTGTDIEIFPKLADGSPSFNKGNGVLGLNKQLGLGVAEGPNLVCGDTSSDVAMIEATLHLMGDARPASNLSVLFIVTPEEHKRTPSLANKVSNLCRAAGAQCAILPSPDVLIAALAHYTRESVRSQH